jgi:hypothetical protein
MATKEQLKGNKKLSIFIDCPLQRKSERGNIDVFQIGVWKDEYIWDKLINRSDLDNSYAVIRNTIPFHSDWNWLMKVVDRILELYPNCLYTETTDIKHTIVMNDTSFRFYHIAFRTNVRDDDAKVIRVTGKNHQDTLYKACVQFVDWHNKNNKV